MKILLSITGNSIGDFIVWIFIIAFVTWILWILLDYFKAPEPLNKIFRGLLIGLAIFLLINAVFDLAGDPLIRW